MIKVVGKFLKFHGQAIILQDAVVLKGLDGTEKNLNWMTKNGLNKRRRKGKNKAYKSELKVL